MRSLAELDFSPPDLTRFPCLRLAYEAAEMGGEHCIALNAADEIAVEAFLAKRIPFPAIPRTIEQVLQPDAAPASRHHRRGAGCGCPGAGHSPRTARNGPESVKPENGYPQTSMTFVLISTVSMLVMLGVLVLVHEFGHFAVAKLCGVRVETFSIGFGKRLFGFRRGDTDYRVSLLPLGGYVKMAGELGGDGTIQ